MTSWTGKQMEKVRQMALLQLNHGRVVLNIYYSCSKSYFFDENIIENSTLTGEK
jgi:hypothetical protein